jgi:TonB-linked SusC/RagA family outer membrane protein
MQFSFAQQKTVTGTVTSEGKALPGATVRIEGTYLGTQTDENGKFSIKSAQGDVLEVSFLGKDTKSITVGSSDIVNVTLVTSVNAIDVVVVEGGYRSTTKSKSVAAATTINAKTIENRPNASFINTLQGQVAGLNITSGNGQPGSKGSVIIRGQGTLNGNTDPLYVIDGFPTNSDNFRSINPNDIESTTVLKDASATSIYGNRGANGVIVVKTKRGGSGEGKTKFRYSTSTGLVELQKSKYDFSNSAQQLDIQMKYQGFVSQNAATGVDYTADVNTDWADFFFRTARTTRHDFSVETSGKNLSSFTSVGYLDNEGILQSTGLKRFTLRNNLNGKSNNGKFEYATNIGLGFTKNNESVSLGTGQINRNMILGATLSLPFISPSEYINSQNVFDLYNASPDLSYTPLFLMDKINKFANVNEESRLNASTDVSYKLLSDLTVKSRTGAELIAIRNVQSEFPGSFNDLLFRGSNEFGGYEDINNRREFYLNQYFGLDYRKTIAEKHTFGASLNAEYYFSQLQANNARQRGLDERFFVPGTGAGYVGDLATDDVYVPQISTSKLKSNLISYFATLDYDFDDRYGLSANVRRDGSSRFGTDYKWGNFWSVGARWNMDNEEFMKRQDLIQVLKLRASYGTTGNQRIIDGTAFTGINPQLFQNTFSTSSAVAAAYNGQAVTGINLGFPGLEWELTTTANVGLDFELYKNRLRGSVDVYNKNTTKLFNEEPVSALVGESTIQKNSEIEVDNTGLELSLAYDVIKNENFKLTLRGNGAYNKNEVSNIQRASGKIINGNTVNQNGHQVNEFYVYPYLGVNPANGNLLFQSANGSSTEVPLVDADRVANGKSSIPVYVGGFGFDADYKGFFASTNFTYAQKVHRFDFDLEGLYDVTQAGQFIVSNDLVNAWTPTNTNTNVPSYFATNVGSQDNSDRFLKDASYVRLRYLQVGWRASKSILKKTFMTDLSISLQGENLVTFTKWKGFDAESNRAADQAQYPTPKIYTLSLDFKF